MSTDRYSSPLSERYASREMQYIFSQDKKFSTWRKLWIALAETEMELGLSQDGKPVITQDMIDEMKAHVDDINYDVAKKREAEVRHDVMSHVYAYGKQCPKAAGIIHLGATSCYVGDNTDIIIMRDALLLVRKKLVNVITPNPPTWISRMITTSPPVVNVVDTSTGTSPVTHTALVAVNNESTQVMPFTVHRGNINNPVPIRMIAKKLTANIREGLVRRPNKRTSPLDKFRKEKISNKTR